MNGPLPNELLSPLNTLRMVNTFAQLPGAFYTRLAPTPLPRPYLVHANHAAGDLIGLGPQDMQGERFTGIFAGNEELPGAQPLAAVYSGHQFGVWAGQLGDGRAILLGEVHHGGSRMEIQLKGSGPTPYSRRGDGRAVLRSSIREHLCSEAMHHLGIASTRSLAIIGSDQPVIRETVETAAVITRMAPSFLRFGSFEHWFHHDRPDELKQLADYVIANFYPECVQSTNPYAALLAQVSLRTARLVAQWQAVGFCHGVMNTDNMSVLGLTLDYGPFGFMEAFDAGHICNHTDDQGRYAYNMQPQVAFWNLYCLGQAMLPLIGEVEEAQAAIDPYRDEFATRFDLLVHQKLGLREILPEDDALVSDMFRMLQESRVDFTTFFRRLSLVRRENEVTDSRLRDLFIDREGFDAWAARYRSRLRNEGVDDAQRALEMNRVNPKYVLRNWLAEIAIRKANEVRDFAEVDRLMRLLSRPFDEQPENEAYAGLPPDWAAHLEVSCSS